MALLVSGVLVIIGDQAIKYLVFNLLENPTVVSSFLRLAHVTNPGVAFGIGKNLRWTPLGKYLLMFTSVAVVVALLLLFARYCKTRLWARISLGLILGGAISNLIDRLSLGHVRDFVDFSFWPTFNTADLAICTGVVLLILGILREEKSKKSAPVTPPSPDSTSPQRQN